MAEAKKAESSKGEAKVEPAKDTAAKAPKVGEEPIVRAIGIYKPPAGGWAVQTLVEGVATETVYPTRAEAEEAEFAAQGTPVS
jgi:hypothetical protein